MHSTYLKVLFCLFLAFLSSAISTSLYHTTIRKSHVMPMCVCFREAEASYSCYLCVLVLTQEHSLCSERHTDNRSGNDVLYSTVIVIPGVQLVFKSLLSRRVNP